MNHFESKFRDLSGELKRFFKSKGKQLKHIHYTFEKPAIINLHEVNTSKDIPVEAVTFTHVQLFQFAQPIFTDSEGNSYHFQQLSMETLCLLADHIPYEF